MIFFREKLGLTKGVEVKINEGCDLPERLQTDEDGEQYLAVG